MAEIDGWLFQMILVAVISHQQNKGNIFQQSPLLQLMVRDLMEIIINSHSDNMIELNCDNRINTNDLHNNGER